MTKFILLEINFELFVLCRLFIYYTYSYLDKSIQAATFQVIAWSLAMSVRKEGYLQKYCEFRDIILYQHFVSFVTFVYW